MESQPGRTVARRPSAGGEPIRLYDGETGRRVRPVVVDRETGEALDPRRLVAGPGPSFPEDGAVRRERFADYYRAVARRNG